MRHAHVRSAGLHSHYAAVASQNIHHCCCRVRLGPRRCAAAGDHSARLYQAGCIVPNMMQYIGTTTDMQCCCCSGSSSSTTAAAQSKRAFQMTPMMSGAAAWRAMSNAGFNSCTIGLFMQMCEAQSCGPCRVLPNCMAKAKGERAPLVGAAVLRTPDLSALTVRCAAESA